MADSEYVVEREDDGKEGRYVIHLAPGVESEMTYRYVADQTIAIEHTLTPREYRGKGIAEKLMLAAIADARTRGNKIVPVCSYVVAQFQRHPDWADLLAA
jgi:predicted GNAT family acetyltransferase